MKFTLAALTLPIGSFALVTSNFNDFKNLYRKSYHTAELETTAKNAFTQNLEKVLAHNRKSKTSYKLEINEFSDMTESEFANNRLMVDLPYPEEDMEFECPDRYRYRNNIPDDYQVSLDWRTASKNPLNKVAVTAVKDQGGCGSCYVFSAAATMEGNMCMNGLKDCSTWKGISEQQVLDCGSYRLGRDDDREWFDFHGCSGGWQSNVIQFNYYTRGVVDSEDYPYVSGMTGKTNECQLMERTAYPDRYICGTTSKSGANATEVKEALFNKGPLAVGMYVGGTFSSYKSGVYVPAETDCPNLETSGINHAMTAVAYGRENGLDYWLIKNSWGPNWGDNGFIKVAAGKNYCGIEGNVAYTNEMVEATGEWN